MKPGYLFCLLLFCCLLKFDYLQAQTVPDTAQVWRIELQNGNTYFGTIISRNTEEIIFNSRELNQITIPVKQIKKMEVISATALRDGEYWFDNPQSTRYFVSSTGYGLRKGEGYYQNVWVLFNQFTYGISDNASIGVGLVPLFLFSGSPTPIWVTPKFSLPVADEFNLGVGAFIGTIVGEDVDVGGAFGVAYGTATFGNRDKNLSVGLGYGFAGGEWAQTPTITISGMLRTGKRGYLLTENYLLGTGDGAALLISFGGRRVGDSLTLDYGGFVPVGDIGEVVIIPWLGVSIPIGKK